MVRSSEWQLLLLTARPRTDLNQIPENKRITVTSMSLPTVAERASRPMARPVSSPTEYVVASLDTRRIGCFAGRYRVQLDTDYATPPHDGLRPKRGNLPSLVSARPAPNMETRRSRRGGCRTLCAQSVTPPSSEHKIQHLLQPSYPRLIHRSCSVDANSIHTRVAVVPVFVSLPVQPCCLLAAIESHLVD